MNITVTYSLHKRNDKVLLEEASIKIVGEYPCGRP